jgi:hypothetical protein
MPSKSKAQRNLMAAAAHNPKFAKKVGVPVKVAKEFNRADKGKRFNEGGTTMKHEDIKLDKKIVKKAVSLHDKQQHGGKKTNLAGLKKGGILEKGTGEKYASKAAMMRHEKKETKAEEMKEHGMKKGGKVKKCAEGGIIKTIKDMFKSAPESPKGKAKGVAITKETITATPGAIPSDIMDTLQTRKNEKAFKDYEKRRESGEDYKKGGCVKKFARGGGCEVRGKTRGRII